MLLLQLHDTRCPILDPRCTMHSLTASDKSERERQAHETSSDRRSPPDPSLSLPPLLSWPVMYTSCRTSASRGRRVARQEMEKEEAGG